ncbi:MAG: efflux RND transporter permease subunit [Gammaproteobacteria bacterium]|nr:efflux RND transporter permease subunit [Gammaproteobacteria bacterium]MYD81403.1 efflux RND transporter permease subunit [Gammaproteobacteria bacterium]
MPDPADRHSSASSNNSGIINWFCRNPVAAYVLLVVVFACGLVATTQLHVETFPNHDPRIIRITVPYPGATPVEVEEDIVWHIEESLIGAVGVAHKVAISEQDLATIDVEIDDSANPIDTLNNVRTAVERVEDFPPLNADQPEVTQLEVQRNVLKIAVSSDSLNPVELRDAAETIRNSLLLVPGIAIVELLGIPDQEIHVEISEEVLRRHGLSFQDIVNAIRFSSVNVTGGDLRTKSGDIVMSTLAKRDYAEEFADIPVISKPDGSIIRLGELARLTDGLVEQSISATLNGSPTIFLQVRVASGIASQEASSKVRQFISNYPTPNEVRLSIWEDESLAVADSISLVLQNGVIGLILVFLVLLLVFDLRIAIWVALGVPVVFVGSLIAFPFLSLSINVITLFAFFILIALVVDDSIIVAESIDTARSEGLTGETAAAAGTKRVLAPIALAGLTTMAAFASLIPLRGAIGQMFSTIPFVVIVVLALALLESAFVLPGHLSKSRQHKTWPLSLLQQRVQNALRGPIETRIVPMITFSARRPMWPLATVVILFLVTCSLIAFQVVRYSPTLNILDDTIVQADLVLPADALPQDLHMTADLVAAAAREVDQQVGGNAVAGIVVTTGTHIPIDTYEGNDYRNYFSNVASVQLKLNPASVRTVSVEEFRFRWQQELDGATLADSITFPTRSNRPTERVSYALIHADRAVLESAVAMVESAWEELPGVVRIEDSLDSDSRRLDVRLNDTGHAAGLSPAAVATQLRNAFYGAEAQRIQRGREEILVMVRYPGNRRASFAELQNERIYLPNSRRQSPLYTVAEIQETKTPSKRIRIDGQNAAVVTAHLDLGASQLGDVAQHTDAEVLPALLNRYSNLQVRRHGMSKELQRVGNTLLISVPIAILFIYGLIASFLRSFIQPLLALAGVPMAFVGAVAGHWILGYELTLISIFGLIAVSGVVVNDTILLMHRYNVIRREGDIPEIAAISAAAQQRARAILITSFTTVIALLPILFSDAESIQFLIPLVVSLTFGLIFAGIGLLFFLPSVLMMSELVKGRLAAIRFRR